VLNEFKYGIETDVIDEVVLCATTFRFGVDSTVIVFPITTAGKEKGRKKGGGWEKIV
jgi:hypothetical protein